MDDLDEKLSNSETKSSTRSVSPELTPENHVVNPEQNRNSKTLIKLLIGILIAVVVVLTIVIIVQNIGKDDPEIVERQAEAFKNDGNYSEEPIVVYHNISKSEDGICTSDVCTQSAAYLLQRIDPSINPCDDFYEHACGRFVEHVGLEKAGKDSLHSAAIIMKNIYKKILDSKTELNKPEKVLKTLKTQCLQTYMKTDLEDFRKQFPIKEEIAKVGKWPILDSSWTDSDYNLTQLLLNYSKINIDDLGFFTLELSYPGGSVNESKVTLREFVRKSKGDSREEVSKYLKEMYSDRFFILVNLLNNNETDVYVDEVKMDIDDVIELMVDLEMSSDNNASETKHVEVLDTWIPDVDWNYLLNSVKPIKNKFRVEDSSYFENDLSRILNKTDPRIITNYLIFKWIMATEASVDLYVEELFSGNANKEQQFKFLDDMCNKVIAWVFPVNYAMAFAYRYIEFDNVDGVAEMTEDLKNEFVEMIMEAEWMDQESKDEAILKIEKMRKAIAYPKGLNDTMEFEERYEKIKIDENDTYFENMVSVRKWKVDTIWKNIMNNEEDLFKKQFYDVNAYYETENNYLVVEAPFVRLPFYDKDRPDYLNLPIVGQIIGHEMGHGFDESGININSELEEKSIYSESTKKKFEEKQECFVDVFGSYKHPKFSDQQVYGHISVHENIADYIGMRLAYRLSEKLECDDVKLPGLQNYTQKELFFYGFASSFCSIPLDRDTFELLSMADHGFNRFRVNGVVSNFDGFSETFGCKKGTRMNPEKKCYLF